MVLDIHTHNIDSAKKGEAIYNLTFEEEQAFPSLPPYLSLSLHPWDLTSNNLEPQLTWIRTKISDGRVVAIGEAGLDKLKGADMDLQIRAFVEMAKLAHLHNLPLIIHNVKSTHEIINLKQRIKPQNPWILHSFRGKPQLSGECEKQDIFLSFSPKYNSATVQSLSNTPFFLETDDNETPIEQLYQEIASIRHTTSELLKKEVETYIKQIFRRL